MSQTLESDENGGKSGVHAWKPTGQYIRVNDEEFWPIDLTIRLRKGSEKAGLGMTTSCKLYPVKLMAEIVV